MRHRARRSVGALAFAIASAVAFACGPPELPAPPLVAHPTSALFEVPYPPPPARVEIVPPRPRLQDAVWIDGEWSWRARRWSWKPGRWVSPPRGGRFAPWTTVRDRLGTLYFAPGTWRAPSGTALPDPQPIAPSGPLPAAVVTPEGEEVREGPVLTLDGGPVLDGGTADVDAELR